MRFNNSSLVADPPDAARASEWNRKGSPRTGFRVLHIGSGNLYGGVEAVLVTLARHGKSCPGLDQRFAVCFPGRLKSELEEARVSVHELGKVKASRPWLLASARGRLCALLANRQFDAVICHSAWCMAMFGGTVLEAQQPLVFWLHGELNGRHWVERWAQRNRPRLVIANSRHTVQSVSLLYPDVKSCVIHCPVEIAPPIDRAGARRAIRNELGVPEEDAVILQVSRMERWKGHLLHLEALAKIREIPGWKCWIVGGAQRREEMAYLREVRSAAERLGIASRVQFLGQREDVPRLLAAADIFCQPNTGPEPFGVVFVEALSAGLPVVTTDMGGPREIVTDECGCLTPPDDSHALARALARLIADAALRQYMGAAGPGRAKELCAPETRIHELCERLAALTHSLTDK